MILGHFSAIKYKVVIDIWRAESMASFLKYTESLYELSSGFVLLAVGGACNE